MSQRLVNTFVIGISVAIVGGCIIYFRYHQFHWYDVIGPGIAVVVQWRHGLFDIKRGQRNALSDPKRRSPEQKS